MTYHENITSFQSTGVNWRGLGGWNLYFLCKITLLYGGYLNFHPLANLVFAAFLLLPHSSALIRQARLLIAFPVGGVLFYYDTWLPGFESIVSQGGHVFSFTADYWLELFERFINWDMIGVGFFILTAYLFLAQWLRFTPWVLAYLLWLWLSPQLSSVLPKTNAPASSMDIQPVKRVVENEELEQQLDQSAPPTSANLNAYLNDFYLEERGRETQFPQQLPAKATPFDVLVINICSLAWNDVEASGLLEHPVWRHFDVMFDSFNSATSYSGPASIRLLRASCGQPSHQDLYLAAPKQCLLMDQLSQLGFEKQVAMDHSGAFGNYLKELKELVALDIAPMSREGLPHDLASFDGEPIYRDDALFARWLNERGQSQAIRNATFFNLIVLHDGNRYAKNRQIAPYKARLRTLLDQLDHFLSELERSGRKVMVVVVPEHGAALAGDRMQMSGLRDIPSPAITRIPVGIAFIGTRAPHEPTRHIAGESSYLAISELVAKTLGSDLFDAPTIDWDGLLNNLPKTPMVSENQGTLVVHYQDGYHIKLGQGEWVPYPQ
ncbi:cellulose biosynthesis protein BcsG [Aeromonas rivipollensis]|uniref:Cellulose biosynthesis protein BcsG n=1 Tax=Aeromonas rivipollensis TaxID=948519 RepID=A0AAW9Y6S4_9GAMM|nr:cellulose biosynthesis protein BcsG [Aeromonas rivipollensis]NEX73603.1 cellulose biosynthesis protein BcsG [Aeromonas rivipollensis]